MNCFPLQQNTKQSMYNQNTKFCFCATVLWNKPILFHLPHHMAFSPAVRKSVRNQFTGFHMMATLDLKG